MTIEQMLKTLTMKILIPSLVLISTIGNAYSQTPVYTVSGLIKNIYNEPVVSATVLLADLQDSIVTKTITSDDNGRFQFTILPYKNYQVRVTAVGQKSLATVLFKADTTRHNLQLPVMVMLPAKITALAGVTIKARRPLLVQEIDKTVVNVDAMISSATGNTLEVLEKTPGVTVSATGEIRLNGRTGVLVLIDGRSTYMSAQDLAAYLSSLPGAILDKIELMDNPPARYDASGNAVINIRLKRNREGGFTGNLTSGYSQGRYARFNDALNVNYNYKRINLFANMGYNTEKNYTRDNFDRQFFSASGEPISRILLLNKQRFQNHASNINLGADYNISANTTLGFLLNGNKNNRRSEFEYDSKNFSLQSIADSTGRGDTRLDDKRNNVGANLNFTHRFSKQGRELTADASYLHYQGNGNQVLENEVYDPQDALTGSTNYLYELPSATKIYTVKADYVHPLQKNIRLEAGVKTSVVDNDNLATYYNTTGGSRIIDNTQTNHFLYHENINAAYVNSQVKWKRVGVQLGLRAENTRATGHQLGNDTVKETRFNKQYLQLFPSVFISYKLDTSGNNTLTVSITRRINRPSYQVLNPFLFMRDQYTYTAGNPLLNPQYQYRYEVRLQHRQFLRLGLSYNRFTNVIFQTTQAVGNVFINKPENIAKGYMLLLNIGVSARVAPWWNLNTDALLSHAALNGIAFTKAEDPDVYMARINLLNQLQFKKGWSAEAGAYYASRDLTGQAVTSGMVRSNVAIQKKFWKENASIRFAVDDIFHSWVYHNKSVGLKQAQYFQVTETDSQRLGIAFTYRFGKKTFARKSKHADNGADEEKGRAD